MQLPAQAFEPSYIRSIRACATRVAVVVCSLALLCAPRASADAGVVLNESLDTSVARITGSGHSAIYLSRICPDGSPTKMRLCRPGEQGSVLSNYTTLGEDQPYEWNIVPLSIYLYGVEDPRNRPLVSSKEIKAVLEERYRQKYLSAICTTKECLTSNGAEWREMVGATLERSLYMFVVKTTVEQDEALIAEFNAEPNHNHFNAAFRNCADFARRVMNTYYPHAVRPDYVNDFLMTSPKAVAHSLTRYADAHPELDLRVLHFAQVPGTIKRSYECRSGTEEIYHSKKFLLPLGIFAWQGIPAAFSTYALTGRFNPLHQFEEHPSVDASTPEDYNLDDFDSVTPDEAQRMAGRMTTIAERDDANVTPSNETADADSSSSTSPSGGWEQANASSPHVLRAKYTVSVQELAADQKSMQEAIVGTKDEWTSYKQQFPAIVDEAIRKEVIPDKDYLKRVFKRLGQSGTIIVDADGSLWMRLPNQETTEKVGISANNILSGDSASRFAYQIILARMEYELNSPKHSRETMIEFQHDWDLVTATNAKERAYAASRERVPGPVSSLAPTPAEATTPPVSEAAAPSASK